MNRVCRLATITLFFLALPAAAQQSLPDPANLRGDAPQTRKRLTEADQKLAAGQPADAIDALQKVLDEAGDDLVSLDGKQYRPARWVAHQVLARLPANALKGYQDRIDDPARRLLDSAKRTRSVAPLWELLDRYFVSRPADEGLLLLGDLLFEKGEFRSAERIWRRLLPDGGADATYPNSKADLAAVRARVVLAVIFAGETGRARAELAAFKVKHPSEKGVFAGKDAVYADTLQATLSAPPALSPAANSGNDWPTFGGSPDRTSRVGVRLPAAWPGRPTWTATPVLQPRHPSAATGPPVRPPVGHPVIFDSQAFVTDGYRLHGYDLVTGKPTTSVVLTRPVAFPQKAMPDASPALTIAGNRLYVRAGTPLVRAPEPVPGVLKDDDTFIACMAPSGGEKGMRELWRVKPPVAEGKAPTAWEGAPLVAGRRMWAAYARFEGGRVVHGVACYEPADGGEAPDRAAWVADVSDSLPATTDGRPRQELLTLAGRHVVFCTNDGAVIALDAVSGKRSWGFRYARSRKADVNRSPDPAPAISCGGRLFLAPADADRVYALDPESGEFLWQSGPTEGAEIVGVAAGKVIIAVSGPVRGLRGLSVVNGQYTDGDGWVQHNGGGQLGYGRGFVTDDVIVWPTRAGLFFVRPQDGELVRPMLNSPVPTEGKQFGNVVYADGVMVVVTPTQVWGYVSDTKRFGPAPGVGPDERGERDPVRTRFEALIEKAENALASGEGSAARGFLVSAIRGDFPKPLRAWAAARLVLLAPPHVPTLLPAPELWPAFDPELNAEWLIPPDGLPVTLKSLLLRHLGGEPAPKSLPASPMVALERKPEDSPTLSDDAEISRTLRLTPGSAPLRWLPNSTSQPKHFFTITADQLLAIPLGEGDNTSHDVADEFTHATDITGGFVAAGRFCVAVYATGRAPIWVFRVPATDKLPAIAGEFRLRPDEIAPSAELSAFRLTGSWLVAKLGERHLIALDLRGKRVAWVLGTNGKPGFRPLCFPDAPRFGSEYFATDTLIVVQLTNGKRWFVNAETGKVLEFPGSDFPTARTPWMLPPTEVEANRLAVSDGPGTVRMLHLATGRMYRTHQQDSEVSLAGPPPQVRAWGGTILIAVTRNQGVELDRFNMKEGTTAWATPAFLDATQVRLANADADADRVYLPVQNKVAAFALKDGKSAWEAKLPDTHGAGGWVVKAGSKCIIAYPENAIPRVPMAEVFAQITRSFRAAPQLERLPALAATVYDAWVTRVVPILLLDPETGKELARFDIPASGPAITVWFERDLAVVATGDRVCWLR